MLMRIVEEFVKTGNLIDSPLKPVEMDGKPNIEIKNLTVSVASQILLDNVNISLPYG